MIFGKLIGALLGYMATGGLLGAALGALVGHFFDRGLRQAMGVDYGAERAAIQQVFFETTFRIAGHLAKADGRISEEEIAHTETLMAHMGLSAEHRRQAIELFKEGAAPAFHLEPQIGEFLERAGRAPLLRQALLEYLISIALADGELHGAEQQVLAAVARYLGISEGQFQRLLAMLRAQEHFAGQQPPPGAAPADALADAYAALGVEADASDGEIKRAYRKLMSQHHPDKLIAKGVPEDMLKLATEKAQEIQAAYELIKRSRA